MLCWWVTSRCQRFDQPSSLHPRFARLHLTPSQSLPRSTPILHSPIFATPINSITSSLPKKLTGVYPPPHKKIPTASSGARRPAVPFATVPIRSQARLTMNSSLPIPDYLLQILVCPACKAPVKPAADSSSLKCQSCRRVYPIRDDIPVMLIDEATIAPE